MDEQSSNVKRELRLVLRKAPPQRQHIARVRNTLMTLMGLPKMTDFLGAQPSRDLTT